VELSEGFRYLGYFIKVEKTSFEDWRWLIIKFENMIKHWCNRWLSLRGRCTLAKAGFGNTINILDGPCGGPCFCPLKDSKTDL
jgi:hypothetical protein